jgi:RimJ/RimL family protein N-acetyltransferase
MPRGGEDRQAQMPHATTLGFRRLLLSDLPLMHRWRRADFVMQFYARKRYSYEELVAHYAPRVTGEAPTQSYIATCMGTPIGYIQTYRIEDYPEYSRCLQIDGNAAGVDLFIGEADFLNRGLGSQILARFLREVVFADDWPSCCVVGPDPGNRRAIRASEKAGFRYLKTVEVPGEDQPEYLMCIGRDV